MYYTVFCVVGVVLRLVIIGVVLHSVLGKVKSAFTLCLKWKVSRWLVGLWFLGKFTSPLRTFCLLHGQALSLEKTIALCQRSRVINHCLCSRASGDVLGI